MDGQTQKGPVSIEQLVENITLDTYVWCDGMDNWQKANSVKEIVDAFSNKQNANNVDNHEDYYQSNNNDSYYHNTSNNNQNNNNYQSSNQNNYQNNYQNNNAPKMQNYFVLSLLCLLLCCVPLGIVSLLNSRNCDKALASGDIEGAKEYAQKAKNWAIAGFITGFIFQILYVVVTVLGNFNY